MLSMVCVPSRWVTCTRELALLTVLAAWAPPLGMCHVLRIIRAK